MDDKVKVSIRLPRKLVQSAKQQAVARGEDLQDMVAAALILYLERLPSLPSPMSAAEGRRLLKAMGLVGKKGGRQ